MINLIFVNDFGFINGGAAKVAIESALIFAKDQKYKVFFIYGVGPLDPRLKNSTIESICFGNFDISSRKFSAFGLISNIYNFRARRQFAKTFAHLDPKRTIVNVHGFIKSFSSSILSVAHKMGFKTCVTLHDYFIICPNGGLYDYHKQKICQISNERARCLICNCDKKSHFEKAFRSFRFIVQRNSYKTINSYIAISKLNYDVFRKAMPRASITLIHNPVEKDNYFSDKQGSAYLFVGRISEEKNCRLFCQAITRMKLKGIVIGDGPEMVELKSEFLNIKFLGWLSPDGVSKWKKEAKCLIFPSKWYEGAPLTPIEFLLDGIPVLTSDVCATKEVVPSKSFVFRSNDLDDLIAKIRFIEKGTWGTFFSSEYLENLRKEYSATFYYEKADCFFRGKDDVVC